MKTGIELIKQERKRQIEVEGWTAEHDSQYKKGELFLAACCYQAAKRMRAITGRVDLPCPKDWPWDPKWWKPSPGNRIRELEKAGALFMAHNELRGKPHIVDEWVIMCTKEINDILAAEMSGFGELRSNEVRALSWKQPYASMMLHGKVETRTWDTKYRGLVLICASKTPYNRAEIFEISAFFAWTVGLSLDWDSLMQSSGKAIAIGYLVDSRPMTRADERDCVVLYRPGLFCHIYKNVQPIEPFEWKGTQGWKILDEETKSKIKLLKNESS